MKGRERGAFSITWADYTLHLGQKTHIMGILNVTPDSFSDGGRYFSRDLAIEHGLAMAADGADIIDVGGESTRPYAERVSLLEELDRIIPVVQGLSKALKIPVSIDTLKADVAEEAIKAGASIINDISAFRFDSRMVSVAAKAGVPVILMHMKGTPSDMQDNPVYDHLIPEIKDFLTRAMDLAVGGGVDKSRIILDPGIGFGKTLDHNLEIIRDLHQFLSLERPILLGTSRKAFLGKILDKDAHKRDIGTMATIAAAVINGASIIRVHNVKMARETIKVIDTIMNAGSPQVSEEDG